MKVYREGFHDNKTTRQYGNLHVEVNVIISENRLES